MSFDGGLIDMTGAAPDYQFFICDHLGSTRVVASAAGQALQSNEYYPFGGMIVRNVPDSSHFDIDDSGVNPLADDFLNEEHFAEDDVISLAHSDQPYKFSGKEFIEDNGLNLYNFGARFYNPVNCRFITMDPLAEKYFSISPYAYCNNNPIIFVDPDGKWWTPKYENNQVSGYAWVDEKDAYVDGKLKDNMYQQAIFFTDNGTFNSSGHNLGSSTAVVYLEDGAIQKYDACTYPSDLTAYPTVPAGQYEASVGMHQGRYTALKMFDVGKSLSNNSIDIPYINPSTGKMIIYGVNIHKSGANRLTGRAKNGKPVSAACFLIDRNEWDSFISHFDNDRQRSSKVSIGVQRK